jgi:hypothetical protein
MEMDMRSILRSTTVLAAALLTLSAGCTAINTLVQPPVFTAAEGRDTELRIVGPAANRPLGGAALRIWTRVQNPNSFGLTLASLAGNVFLQNHNAGEVSFPLGLPLLAGADTIIPLDVTISFADVPGLVDVAQQIMTQNRVAYRLDGTVTLDAAPFGQPTFGPSTWIQGESRVIR